MKGVYLLFLGIVKRAKLNVGQLGKAVFPPGVYVYIGSGQRNVEKRIMRHFNKDKKIKWHIDYLLSSNKCKPLKAVVYPLSKEYECKIAMLALNLQSLFIRGFGSTDCKCVSHLFKLDDPDSFKENLEKLFRVKPILIYPS